ncbi:MAG: phosphoglycerate kinase [Candidatus Yanofskybacteria bacterium]|nr:phosphoglycerate kinase [Candidatus Yanofskybacteria bacterium]
MKFLEDLGKKELDEKKVFLRVDFDVPVEAGKIKENFRIKAQKETIDYLANNGAKVMLAGHISSTDSFFSIAEEIGEIIGHTLTLVPHSELNSIGSLFTECPVLLLDNLRQDSREEQNKDEFARGLSKGFDFYVNNDFAVCHRSHASVSAITKYLPSYAGFLVKKEVENLSKAIKAPLEGKILVVGGAKISTKLPVIKNFLDKAEKVLIGGALANNFFKEQGVSVGSSVVDNSVTPNFLTPGVRKLILPEDILVSFDKTGETTPESYPVKNLDPAGIIVDIGPETAKHFGEIIRNSSMVIWNGPMGLSEVEKFAGGTRVIAEAVTKAKYSIIGGGDTVAAVDKLGLLGKFSYVSTGGGAMLAFLAGEELPGLRVLGYYPDQSNQ